MRRGHSTGHESEGLDMEERKESEDLELTYLLCCPTCFSGRHDSQVPRESLLELGAGITGRMKRKFGGKDLCV